VNERLDSLKKEMDKGRQRLEVLDRERQEIRDTMLRISGAIQVLEELKQGVRPLHEEALAATS
jgi:hypothetical protein